jgi:ribosomal silencing factor RsfS
VTVSHRARELAVAAAEAASDKLADDILAFDVGDQLVITDVFVLCSAPNDRQVKAIVDAVETATTCTGCTPAIHGPGSTWAFAAGWHRCSTTTAGGWS